MCEKQVTGGLQDGNGNDAADSPTPTLTSNNLAGAKLPSGVTDESAPPNGGLKAWSQVVGSVLFFFNTW